MNEADKDLVAALRASAQRLLEADVRRLRAERRERIAVQLLAGLLVDPRFAHGSDYTGGIEIALRLTDALIAKLDEDAAANEPLGDKPE